MPAKIVFLFHMHQPYYIDLAENKSVMPWVRLHGIKGYYDIPYLISKLDKTKITVNLVPSLIEQILLYSERRITDTFLDLSLKHPSLMSEDEKFFLIDNFFSVNRKNFIETNERYFELLKLRGESEDIDALKKNLAFFKEQDLIDLQALFNLSWFGFAARHEFEEINALSKKQSFTFDDVRKIIDIQFKVIERIIPLYKELFSKGRIDISVSPYFHPILPLIIDSDIARVCLPEKPLPPRFSFEKHARWHVEDAVSFFEKIFGRKPSGMWPSEGSVSDETLELIASCGIKWIATDEGILEKSGFEGKNKLDFLYKPYSFRNKLNCFFRDRELSDKIGFVYYNMKTGEAVSDFLNSVERIVKFSKENPVIPVIFDGENPWEFYPDYGEDFLKSLFVAIEECDFAETSLFSEFSGNSALPVIQNIWPGSWINSNFAIWIGHSETNTAWSYLRRAASFFEEKSAEFGDSEAYRKAKKEIMVAEGSDWFWWYGDDFQVKGQEKFDLLFLKHLSNVYRFLGEEVPLYLKTPIKKSKEFFSVNKPKSLVFPSIDGKITDFFEWRNAGCFTPLSSGGAMYEGKPPIKKVFFGQDFESVYFAILHEKDFGTITIFVQDKDFYSINFKFKKGCFDIPVLKLDGDNFVETGIYADVCIQDIAEIRIDSGCFNLQHGETLRFAVAVKDNVREWRLPVSGFLETGVTFPPEKNLLILF